MGAVISLDQRRAARASAPARRGAPPTPAFRGSVRFAFVPASARSYLALERVQVTLPGAIWTPVLDPGAGEGGHGPDAAVEARAAALGMPLVWPERVSRGGLLAYRAARWAADQGHGPVFAVALSRLAFCGGFDPDDPEVLLEAAAAARLDVAGCLQATDQRWRDADGEAAHRRLRAESVQGLPAVCAGAMRFGGEERLAEAAAWLSSPFAGGRAADDGEAAS